MPAVFTDTYGHGPASSNGFQGAALAAAAVGTSNAPGLIIPSTNAGASPTVTSVSANDTAGNFVLNPVTGGGAQASGSVVTVNFANAWAAIPKAVIVVMVDNAAASTPIACLAQSITAGSFTINVSSALTTAHAYTVWYVVAP